MYNELNSDNLSEIVSNNEKVMVQYGAGWCGNCRIIKPKFKKYSEEFSDMEFVMVDAEQFPESRQLAQVDNLPTFAYFQNGELKNQLQTNKADVLKEWIQTQNS